jgi:hypothetical protein
MRRGRETRNRKSKFPPFDKLRAGFLAKDARSGAARAKRNSGVGLGCGEIQSQSPHPLGKLGAGSIAKCATRVGHPEEGL